MAQLSSSPLNVPKSEVKGNETFSAPPLDGSMTMPQMIDHHLEHSTHPLFVYESAPSPGSKERLTYVSWKTAAQAIHRAARFFIEKMPTAKPGDVISIAGTMDNLTYFTMVHGLIRAGFAPLLLSPRNSVEATEHLISKTDSHYLFVSGDEPTQALAKAVQSKYENKQAGKLVISPLPRFVDLYPRVDGKENSKFQPLPPMETPDLDATTLVLHSSGSTSFPKPIALTHRYWIQVLRSLCDTDVDLQEQIMAGAGLAMFHVLAQISCNSAIATGYTISFFSPTEPLPLLTPSNVLKTIESTRSTFITTVPTFLETWCSDPHAIAILKNMAGVMVGGAALGKTVGDELVRQGVSLFQAYGLTETGVISALIHKKSPGWDWEYFRCSPLVKYAFVPQDSHESDVQGGTFEVLVVASPLSTPAVINAQSPDGEPAYATNDLVVRHPTDPELWKIVGRKDDQIMLSTGEKTNPGPLETIILKDPRIRGAVIFGRGRVQNGLLVEPVAEFQFDSKDEEKLAEFRNKIWPSVQQANEYAPTHSRLFKEMIIVADMNKPFTYTPKGNARRHAVIAAYEAEIDTLYKNVEEFAQFDEGGDDGVKVPENWEDGGQVKEFVGTLVRSVIAGSFEDDRDIFEVGCDSLQATRIRNSILHVLRNAKINTHAIPQSFVYDHPSIDSLAKFVYGRCSSSSSATLETSTTESKIADMEAMVAKYSASFPQHKPSAGREFDVGEIVMVTGTTGGLGASILAQLIAMPSVKRVFAFNRAARGGQPLRQRQIAAFEDRGFHKDIIDDPKVVLVEGDLAAPLFGVEKDLYEQMRDSLTFIIHNAWRVDWKVSLSSFEPLIRGLRGLIDLALASPRPSPPRLLFESSIAVIHSWTSSDSFPEQPISDPKVAVGAGGYGESKWVAERILDHAAKESALRPIVVRIGQVSGASNGSWNVAEWVPAIVRSGQVLGCLPDIPGEISWIPLDSAAAAIVDFRNAPENDQCLHLVHPRPVPWSTIFSYLSSVLHVPLVPYTEWLRRLEECVKAASGNEVEAGKKNPAIRLIDTYRAVAVSAVNEDGEAMSGTKLSTKRAVVVAPALGEDRLPHLGLQDVENWVGYWKSVGFLDSI